LIQESCHGNENWKAFCKNLQTTEKLSSDRPSGLQGDVDVLEGDEGEDGAVGGRLLHRHVQNSAEFGKNFPTHERMKLFKEYNFS
jgi:hypothetical protein